MVIGNGQSLLDIAIQQYGAVEAAFDIALANGLCVTEQPEAGTELEMPSEVYDLGQQTYCRSNGVSPATGIDNDTPVQFGGIGYMAVGIDFIVS